MIMRDALNVQLQFYLHALHDCHLLISHWDYGLLILFLCIFFLWTHCVLHLSVLSLDIFFLMWLVFFNTRLYFLQRKLWTVTQHHKNFFLSQPVPSMAVSSDIFSNFVIWFPTTFHHGILYFYKVSYMIENISIMTKYICFWTLFIR